MPPKRNISFTKPPEPAFIKRMKDAIGYKEGPNVETKTQYEAYDDDDEADKDDEKPVVVVLNPGDLAEEEVTAITEKDKKIVFSKPEKKEVGDKNSLDFSSKKADLQKKINSHKEKTEKVKNSSLLSFDEDEDY